MLIQVFPSSKAGSTPAGAQDKKMVKQIIVNTNFQKFLENTAKISLLFQITLMILFFIFDNDFLLILFFTMMVISVISSVINIYILDKKIREIEIEIIKLLISEKGGNE